MYSVAKGLSVFALTAFGLLATTGGCSGIGEAIDCNQMCIQMRDCMDSDLDVHACAESCEDRVEDNALADKLDACTDCLDRDQSCSEVGEECSVCAEVELALRR